MGAIDEYLARVKPDQRAALSNLRRTIRAAAPKAEEYIGYGLAAFRLDGKPLVAFGASGKHCAFYPMNGTSAKAHKGELEGRETSKGTIRFQPKDPLPVALVRRIVKERIAENKQPQKHRSTERTERMKTAERSNAQDQIAAYSKAQPAVLRTMCDHLRELIDADVPKATSKVWHGSPVWFIDGNPVVGYSVKAKGVSLLFWNGQAIDKKGLEPVGKYGAAEATFAEASEIDDAVVHRWLRKARTDVFDSKGFFKKMREGK